MERLIMKSLCEQNVLPKPVGKALRSDIISVTTLAVHKTVQELSGTAPEKFIIRQGGTGSSF
jgi:hypothetical protein